LAHESDIVLLVVNIKVILDADVLVNLVGDV